MYDKIIDALRRGDDAQALIEALALVKRQPQNAQAHRWLAAALQTSGQSETALDSISRAISLAPEDGELHLVHAGLLLGLRKVGEAGSALSKASELNPNDFSAYLAQAQLALSRGDLEEGARLSRLAARVEPDHPQLAAIDGMLALRRGQADEALKIATIALRQQPDDQQLLFVLGLAYQQSGNLAFAEQALRRVRDSMPTNKGLHSLIADLVNRQGRPAEAANELEPLLNDSAIATIEIKRYAGGLRLQAGQFAQALPLLRDALHANPEDAQVLQALMQAWRELGADEDARSTLEALLSSVSGNPDLWRNRLELEPATSESAQAVMGRWLEAMPRYLPALEMQIRLHDINGRVAEAEAVAKGIVEMEPGNLVGEQRLVQAMFERDPKIAIDYLDEVREKAPTDEIKLVLQRWKAKLHDLAGDHSAAVAIWQDLARALAAARLPLWAPVAVRTDWPPLARILNENERRSIFLFGTPGSSVDSVAATMSWLFEDLRTDRFSPAPPNDGFQNYNTAAALDSGSLQGEALIEQWRAGLSSRGLSKGYAIDWLVWWDNALLHALRPYLPESLLLFVLRDPRDMLIDWLAFDALPPLAFGSVEGSAGWLAQVLEQIAALHEQDLFPHRLLKVDAINNDPRALAGLLGDALDMDMQMPILALGPARLPPGHWRKYAQVLAEPFALLTPVAVRLGYPEN